MGSRLHPQRGSSRTCLALCRHLWSPQLLGEWGQPGPHQERSSEYTCWSLLATVITRVKAQYCQNDLRKEKNPGAPRTRLNLENCVEPSLLMILERYGVVRGAVRTGRPGVAGGYLPGPLFCPYPVCEPPVTASGEPPPLTSTKVFLLCSLWALQELTPRPCFLKSGFIIGRLALKTIQGSFKSIQLYRFQR